MTACEVCGEECGDDGAVAWCENPQCPLGPEGVGR
jgi:hypothetical protein